MEIIYEMSMIMKAHEEIQRFGLKTAFSNISTLRAGLKNYCFHAPETPDPCGRNDHTIQNFTDTPALVSLWTGP